MENSQKKMILGKFVAKLKIAIGREKFVTRELESDKATLKYLSKEKEAGTELEDSIYNSYDEWMEHIKKQIKVGENTLDNIEFKKIELEAVEAYISTLGD